MTKLLPVRLYYQFLGNFSALKVAVAFGNLLFSSIPFPVIAIFIFLGSYSVIGMSLESPAAMATPCARPNFNIDCTFLPKKGASIVHPDCVSINSMVRSK
jgi:hypothetical protein